MAEKSVVVTGCGSGIGRAIALRLAGDGWRVVGIELNAEGAASTAGQLGPNHHVVTGDASERAVLAAAREKAETLAPLKGWVNNVGIALMGNLHEPKEPEVTKPEAKEPDTAVAAVTRQQRLGLGVAAIAPLAALARDQGWAN